MRLYLADGWWVAGLAWDGVLLGMGAYSETTGDMTGSSHQQLRPATVRQRTHKLLGEIRGRSALWEADDDDDDEGWFLDRTMIPNLQFYSIVPPAADCVI